MTTNIQKQITRLEKTKDEIRTAIMEKGVVVSATDLFSTYPTRISQISTQSGTYDESLKKLLDGSYTSYSIPEGTSILRNSAFNTYTGLTSITIPSSLTYSNKYAFFDCTSLTKVNITDLSAWCRITFEYGNGDYTSNPLVKAHKLYLNNTLLTSLEIPSGITQINDCTFRDCTSITSVVIPDSVTSIGNYAFSNCNKITEIEIGTGVKTLGNNAFEWCSALTSLTIKAETPPTLGNGAVLSQTNNCPIYVPADSVDTYKSAWSNYASRIVGMSKYALFNSIVDRSITSIVVPEGVETVGQYAFSTCASLTTVTLPTTLTSIENNAFYSCTALETVTCKATTPPALNAQGFNTTNSTFIIYVPSESVEDYKTTTNWSTYASRIQAIS